MIAKRKPGRPRKNPVAVEDPYFALSAASKKAASRLEAMWTDQPTTARTHYVYRPGSNGDHFIDAESIAVHKVTAIAKAASRGDAECLVRILNGERAGP